MSRESRTNVASLIPAFAWVLCIAIPLVYLVIISFGTRQEYAASPLGLPATPNVENYRMAWTEGELGRAFLNNTIITFAAVTLVVLLGSMAAYAVGRWSGRNGSRFYTFFVIGLIVPFQLGLPTLFKMWAQVGLTNSIFGVVLIHVGASLPLAIFLYSGFLLTIPIELEESARIDGAGDVRTFTRIVFPLLRPITATVVIFTSIGVWNDLIVSLFFLQSRDNQTLTRATIGFMSTFNSNVPVIFACAVLTVIPIVVLFVAFQRFFLSGLIQGALKG